MLKKIIEILGRNLGDYFKYTIKRVLMGAVIYTVLGVIMIFMTMPSNITKTAFWISDISDLIQSMILTGELWMCVAILLFLILMLLISKIIINFYSRKDNHK